MLPWVAAGVAIAVIAFGIVSATGSGDKHTSVASVARRKGPIVMPSVFTFKVTEAVSSLAREGVDPKQIMVNRVPRENVGPGTVIDQDPQAGMNVEDFVRLTVSRAPDKVPNFVGKDINTARATLSTLDVTLTVDNALAVSVSDGIVMQQSPAAGAPFAKAIRLTVARKPILINLGDLNLIGSTPMKSAATIGATAFPNSLIWDVSVCPGAPTVTASYALGGHYRKLFATAGLSSGTQDPADRVHLDVTVDGEAVMSRSLDLQTPVPIDIDLTGRKRLVLTFTPVGGGDPKCANAAATLGHAQVVSTAENL
ncbi:MAG: hypothetical protein QOG50_1507 [Actinomycetota bacterium]|nr:hypothetical protein [Actinomycetota bacterium]